MSVFVRKLSYVELVCDECAAMFEWDEFMLFEYPSDVREAAHDAKWTHDRDAGRDLCADCATAVTR